MAWNLFLDDERNIDDVTWAPPNVSHRYKAGDWIICRTWGEVAVALQCKAEFPEFISFDHDLGDTTEFNGYEIAKFLVESDMDGVYKIPDNFGFFVHSQNPVGKKNIELYLNNYLEFCIGN